MSISLVTKQLLYVIISCWLSVLVIAPFQILGVGGLSYNEDIDTWTVCSENIIGFGSDDEYPDISLPRLYHLKLNFTSGSVSFTTDKAITVNPPDKLKLEDIAAVPNTNIGEESLERDMWLVSEANSHLAKTNIFLSKDFGVPDLSSFDPDTYSTSRLIRVDAKTGVILEEATLPDFSQWDQEYDWDGR